MGHPRSRAGTCPPVVLPGTGWPRKGGRVNDGTFPRPDARSAPQRVCAQALFHIRRASRKGGRGRARQWASHDGRDRVSPCQADVDAGRLSRARVGRERMRNHHPLSVHANCGVRRRPHCCTTPLRHARSRPARAPRTAVRTAGEDWFVALRASTLVALRVSAHVCYCVRLCLPSAVNPVFLPPAWV